MSRKIWNRETLTPQSLTSEETRKPTKMNNTDRKYCKQLNRNGWMARLQRFVWRSRTPDFVGYCPFFWFTWLTLIVLPFYLLLLVIVMPFVGLKHLYNKIPKHPTRPSYEDLLAIYDLVIEHGQEIVLHIDNVKIQNWINATPDWWNCVLAAVAKRNRKITIVAKRAAKDRSRLKWVANRLHYIIKPLLWGGFAVAAYVLAKSLVWIIPIILRWPWPKIGEIVFCVLILGISVCIAVVLIMGIEALWKLYRKKCPKCPDKIGFWYWLGSKLIIPFYFLWETIEVIYTRECPLIEWGDESKPIQRNERAR